MFRESGMDWKYSSKKGKPLTAQEFEKATNRIVREMHATTKAFADDSEAAKLERKRRAGEDFECFCKTYLPHYFYKDFGDIHKSLIKYTQTGGKAINLVAFPREHGKSAISSFAKPLQLALTGQSPYTIILSDTNDLACEMIQWIKIECEENSRIKQDFGEAKTEGWWEKDDIVLFGRYRIRGMGHQQKVRGTRFMQFRPFYIVIDDLENDINVKNKQLVQEKLDWILGAVYGSMADNGTLLMVGTMLDKDSVLARLNKHIEDKGEEFKIMFGVKSMNTVVIAAILDENTENERPAWPEGKTLGKLKQIRYMVGAKVWASEFQNRPIDSGQIKLDWMREYEREILILKRKEWSFYSGSDLSAGEKEQNDFKSHLVVALDRETKKRYVADAWIRKCLMNAFHMAYIGLYEEYRMIKSAYETNGFQIYIKRDLVKLCHDRGLYPNFVEVVQTANKFDRILGGLAGMIEWGDLLFDKNNKDQQLLIHQLNVLGTKEHDDGPDALETAVSMSQDDRGKFEFKSAGSRTGGEGMRNMRVSAMARGEYL
jgi:predicted phage terminase large subunit-like protein